MSRRNTNPDTADMRRDDDEWLADMRWLMGSAAGRRVVWRMLSMAGVYANCFDANGAKTSFNCGRQSVGQSLLAEVVRAAPDEYIIMQKERAGMDS